jgi:hypothetical protein
MVLHSEVSNPNINRCDLLKNKKNYSLLLSHVCAQGELHVRGSIKVQMNYPHLSLSALAFR